MGSQPSILWTCRYFTWLYMGWLMKVNAGILDLEQLAVSFAMVRGELALAAQAIFWLDFFFKRKIYVSLVIRNHRIAECYRQIAVYYRWRPKSMKKLLFFTFVLFLFSDPVPIKSDQNRWESAQKQCFSTSKSFWSLGSIQKDQNGFHKIDDFFFEKLKFLKIIVSDLARIKPCGKCSETMFLQS